MSAEALAAFKVLSPPVRRQRAIADYLDRETARIDALIAAKKKLIELLEERFATFALVQILGLDFSPDTRTSRSRLYGLIPAAWGETQLRHVDCEVQTGPFGSQLHAEDYVEDGWPVVNPTNLSQGEIIAIPTMTVSDSTRQTLVRHSLLEGDIVLGRRGEMGRAGLVGPENVGWLCGTGSLRVRLRGNRLLSAYLKLLLETPPARSYFELASVGSTMDNLNSEILLAFPVLVPSIREQHVAVSSVAAANRVMSLSIRTIADQLDLLAERRQALITAAVTGELEIPGAAA